MELKRIKQKNKIIEEFVQKFKKIVRESEYKERLLVEEFKRRMNRVIRRKLIETERFFRSIKQQYKKTKNLNKHWMKSKKEEERL